MIETVREKFTCRDCEKISQPPAPFHATPRGFIGPQLLATILFDKFGMHIPLNRQSVRFKAERIERIVILDTGLFTGRQRMTDAWTAFRDFVERTEDLPVGFLVRGACKHDPGDDVIAAYDAPYPDAASKAGARAFPLLIPRAPDEPGAAAGQRVHSLREDKRPKLVLWADSDPILPPNVGVRFAEAVGAAPPRPIEDASHFLQEDQGPLIGGLIADWLTAG